jgi:hypothetical protein
MAPGTSSQPNPMLKDLEGLVGEWEMELSHAAFLPHPTDTVKGQVLFEWIEHGAFLAMRMGDDALWLISRDDSQPDYEVFYYDTRSVSRLYQMSFSEQTWKIWRTSPNFSQRFEGSISKDGHTITGRWEKSSDGVKWEHDFDVTYTQLARTR